MKNRVSIIGLLIVLCIASPLASAQKDSTHNWALGLHFTPSFSFVQHKNQGDLNPDLYETIIADDFRKLVHAASLTAHYRASERFEFLFGVGYQQLGHKTSNYISQLSDSSFSEIQFCYNHYFLSVPIRVNYHFGGFFAGIGTDLNFHLKSKELAVSIVDDGKMRTKTELQNEFEKFNPIINLTIGCRLPLHMRMHFHLAPTVGFSPTYLYGKDSQINRKYWNLGIQMGLTYTL